MNLLFLAIGILLGMYAPAVAAWVMTRTERRPRLSVDQLLAELPPPRTKDE